MQSVTELDATDDVHLLTRWRDGDAPSGRVLFARYFDALYRFFATKIDDPDELVQATFLALLRDQFAGRSSFRTYVYTIARHTLYRHLRERRRARGFDPEVSSIADLVTTPTGRIARDQARRRVVDALRTLPVEQQLLLELHYWEELDAPALAEVLEVSPGAVRVRLHRARAALEARLGSDTMGACPMTPRRSA
jgi:RNA polymerase sigma-70 factor (ECF subfamily)